MMQTGIAELEAYARDELRGGFVMRGYRPKEDLLRQVVEKLPRAHVVVVSAAWCPDCRGAVPKLARIAQHLPGWTFELRGDDEQTRDQLAVRAIPTFVVQATPGGPELGRIVEHGKTGTLEGDLLAIANRTT
jgi:thiol-disulfide isomerase/thioredoxin